MAKLKEKEEAIRLRKLGKSYGEIRGLIRVSKDTLSRWLNQYPLSTEQREALDMRSLKVERYRKTRRARREILLRDSYIIEKKKILPFSRRDLFVGGLFLYWGEGGKTQPSQPVLSNTDPAIIKAYISWLGKSFGVSRNDLRIKLHLYQDMDVGRETGFWSDILGIHQEQFVKPYIKESSLSGLSYKGGFGHGTCNVLLRNAIVGKRIMAGLSVLRDYFTGPVA